MTITFFTTQIARYLSILGFIIALLVSYQQLTPEVTIDFNSSGELQKTYSRDFIFYIVAGIMLISNMVFIWMGRLFQKLPDGFLKLPGAIKWMFYRKQLNSIILEWMNIGAVVVNTILGASMYILSLVSSSDSSQPLVRYEWVLSIAMFLVFVWIVYIPLRLLLTNPVKERE